MKQRQWTNELQFGSYVLEGGELSPYSCVKSSLEMLIYFGVFINLKDVTGLSDELPVEGYDSISQIIWVLISNLDFPTTGMYNMTGVNPYYLFAWRIG